MAFTFITQEHTTGVGVSSFAVNLHLVSPDPASSASRGELFVSALVNSPDARLGKELNELITQNYFTNNSSTFEALRSSLEDVVHAFKQKQIFVEIVGASYVDNVVYLFSANGGSIFLIRDGNVNELLVTDEEETKSASGYISEGDIIMITTRGYSELFSTEEMEEILNEVGDIEELKQVVADEVSINKKQLAFQVTQVALAELVAPEEEDVAIPQPATTPANFRLKIASAIDKLIRIIPERKVVLREDTIDNISTKRSKIPVIMGIFMLVGLLLSIWFGVNARSTQQRKAEYQDELLAAQHQFDEARSLSEINAVRAKELILSAKQTVDQLNERGIEDEELRILGVSIEENLGTIAGIYTKTPSVFLDLSLIRADFQGSDMAFSEGVIRVLDAEHKRVTLINSQSKKTENLGDLDLVPNASQITTYADRTFVLSTDGIREVQQEVSLVVKDEDWHPDNVLVGAFGGNLYVLDKSGNKIWRYAGGVSSFGEGQEWFAPGINVNVTEALSWVIDGKVWILKSDGDVVVYERGLPQRFVMEGVEDSAGFKQIFTDESAQNVYLLDTERSRIVILDKNGVYQGEYRTSELAHATDLVVSEADKKIIFLAQNKLWELTLQ